MAEKRNMRNQLMTTEQVRMMFDDLDRQMLKDIKGDFRPESRPPKDVRCPHCSTTWWHSLDSKRLTNSCQYCKGTGIPPIPECELR